MLHTAQLMQLRPGYSEREQCLLAILERQQRWRISTMPRVQELTVINSSGMRLTEFSFGRHERMKLRNYGAVAAANDGAGTLSASSGCCW
jgi:hypothetical protein